jgi:hypothetical protein
MSKKLLYNLMGSGHERMNGFPLVKALMGYRNLNNLQTHDPASFTGQGVCDALF